MELASGRRFDARAGEPFLDAAARAGVNLPYSCKTGRCSSCQCRVLTGRTTPLQAETGLGAREAADRWILACVRAAESDLALEADDLGGLMLPSPRTLPCRILDIEKLAPDVVRVRLRLPPAANFDFLPGQYIQVIGPQGIRRSYSLACGGPDRSLGYCRFHGHPS